MSNNGLVFYLRDKSIFIKALTRLMEQHGSTRETLPQVLDVNPQTVEAWLDGTQYPCVENLMKLAELFNVSIDKLLTGTLDTVDPNQEPLKPCPFCGSPATVIRTKYDSFSLCSECGASGPHCYNEKSAIAFWNDRYTTLKPKTDDAELFALSAGGTE